MTRERDAVMGFYFFPSELTLIPTAQGPLLKSQARFGGQQVLMWSNHETGEDPFLDIPVLTLNFNSNVV